MSLRARAIALFGDDRAGGRTRDDDERWPDPEKNGHL